MKLRQLHRPAGGLLAAASLAVVVAQGDTARAGCADAIAMPRVVSQQANASPAAAGPEASGLHAWLWRESLPGRYAASTAAAACAGRDRHVA
jgi:hypothetical protein